MNEESEERDRSYEAIEDARDQLERVTAERDAYRAMLCDVIASAHPNERDHPAMTAQWDRARELLKHGPMPCSK